ncbi:MAG TPA: ATP-binding cassette domain-containing protein, partial [Acidimicrobiales bacterium]|nr:ATP-binding cassette domain-containing protein [Acidimicrobiales bacterium]
MIEVSSVSKWFGDVVAVSEVSFGVGPGVTALLGPNGAGKSTVLRVIAGLTAPSKGRATVLGRDPRAEVEV